MMAADAHSVLHPFRVPKKTLSLKVAEMIVKVEGSAGVNATWKN